MSGHLLFGELAELTGDKRYVELVLSAANMGFDKDGKPLTAMPTHTEMSDAVFMGCPILAHAGKLTGDAKYQEMCLTHLKFMEKLCLRSDGLYRHSPLDEAAWGRGNGFPALGLCWSLDELPESFAGRDLHSAGTSGASRNAAQVPGCDRHVASGDRRPESYREFTATAMICYAMMRGVQEGRLDRAKFRRVDRTCLGCPENCGSRPTARSSMCAPAPASRNRCAKYYDRPAILGRDDRGGAMALMVATERELYEARLAKQ